MTQENVSTMTTEAKVAGFVAKLALSEGGTAITPDTSLLDSGLVDSTGIIEVVSFLEAEFGITIADEDIVPENFENVRRIAAFVESKRPS